MALTQNPRGDPEKSLCSGEKMRMQVRISRIARILTPAIREIREIRVLF
jgi:hypothetical protein